MKLLLFIYSLGNGGAERVTANLANYWARKGWQVTILTLADGPDFYELHPAVRRMSLSSASDGGNVLLGVWNNLRRIRMLRRALKQLKPDVALAMMTSANVLLALAARGMRDVTAIGSERVYPQYLPARSLWGRLRRWSYGQLAAVAAQTEDAKIWFQSNTLAVHVTAIPNPAEWPLPIHAPIVAPADVVMKGTHVLLTVGRLDPQKGFDWLIEVFATLVAKYPDWVLVMLGEGLQRKSLETQIAEARLTTKVFLPGTVGNVGQWYSHADLYVCSSRFEGFPNTLLEALAHGVAAVSFDCETGPRDIIRDGIDGLLVSTGDLPALTAALDRLMGDEAARRGFAGRAVEARERFSMERVAGMWEALFMQVRLERAEAVQNVR
jgi:glycosyltransferase involved in cell wall biosynthesis